jgi:hypothetical protein
MRIYVKLRNRPQTHKYTSKQAPQIFQKFTGRTKLPEHTKYIRCIANSLRSEKSAGDLVQSCTKQSDTLFRSEGVAYLVTKLMLLY